MNERLHLGAIALSTFGLLACGSSEPVNIGDVATVGASLSDYAGNWAGYAEAHQFYDGSDRVHIMLDANGDGVVEVGDSDPLPPPTADTGYPPADPGDPLSYDSAAINAGKLLPGFSYPVSAATVEEHRIRFSAASTEIYREWCSLMTPVLDEYNSTESEKLYGCLRNDTTGSTNDTCTLGDEPIDCSLLNCQTVCSCNENACTLLSDTQDVLFDGALQAEGNELVGTLVVASDRLTVRLTRL